MDRGVAISVIGMKKPGPLKRAGFGQSLAAFIERPQARQIGAGRKYSQRAGVHPRQSATTPSTRNTTAPIVWTSLIGTLRVIASPNQTTGALASIMPSVVPATTLAHA